MNSQDIQLTKELNNLHTTKSKYIQNLNFVFNFINDKD